MARPFHLLVRALGISSSWRITHTDRRVLPTSYRPNRNPASSATLPSERNELHDLSVAEEMDSEDFRIEYIARRIMANDFPAVALLH